MAVEVSVGGEVADPSSRATWPVSLGDKDTPREGDCFRGGVLGHGLRCLGILGSSVCVDESGEPVGLSPGTTEKITGY